jgi:hypothetical protein
VRVFASRSSGNRVEPLQRGARRTPCSDLPSVSGVT